MKLVFSTSLLLLLGGGTLAVRGQGRNTGGLVSMAPNGVSAQQSDAETSAVKQPPIACPIAMRAQHVADGEMVKTGSARPRGIGQSLRLILTGPDSRRIAKATLMIRGLSPKGRAMDALKNEDDSFDTITQQIVHFTAGPDRHDLADLWVPGMTAVRTIEISSVTYADGSTWKHYGDMTCRVTPDGFMSVGGR